MGNKACCDTRNREYEETFPKGQELNVESKENGEVKGEDNSHFNEEAKVEQSAELSPQAQERLAHYQEQEQEKLGSNPKCTQFGNEKYYGSLDEENRPSGHGKIHRHDGSVYLGEWQAGKANGHGVYISKEGSFYEGEFRDNRAEGQGKYFAGNFNYEGYFENNKFNGKGTEKSDQHSFHGDFRDGKKDNGKFIWSDGGQDFEYNGSFCEEGRFSGNGRLNEPKGIYQGGFQNGEKHGKGVYKFENGLRYEGQYQRGAKQGYGTIYNSNASIAYEGEFNNDVPDGKGYVYDKSGNRMERTWVRGIDSSALV